MTPFRYSTLRGAVARMRLGFNGSLQHGLRSVLKREGFHGTLTAVLLIDLMLDPQPSYKQSLLYRRVPNIARLAKDVSDRERAYDRTRASLLSDMPDKRRKTPSMHLDPVQKLRGHQDVILRITWKPDGTYLATGSTDTTARIWDPSTAQTIAVLKGHSHGVNQATWSPHSTSEQLATCSFDRTIKIWSTRNWELIRTLEGHQDDVPDVAWRPDGQVLASASTDRRVLLWSATEKSFFKTVHPGQRKGSVRRMLWLDMHSLAMCSDEGLLQVVLEPDSDQPKLIELPGPGGGLVDLTYCAQNTLLATCSFEGRIRVWQWPSMAVVRDITVSRLRNVIRSVSFSPTGEVLAANSAGENGSVHFWGTRDWQEITRMHEPTTEYWPCNITWAPNADRIATLGERDRAVRLFDVRWDGAAAG